MTGLRPVIPRMRSQQAGRPQFVWIPKRDRLRAGKRDKPSPSFRCNHCFASRPVRARSSSAANTPNSAARSRHRVTVCWLTPVRRATA
jgi:hypothetical protein